MDFRKLLDAFTAAVVAGDGKGLAALFTEDGVYHDGFYGAFAGHEAVREMLEERFHRDAGDFQWAMRDPVCNGRVGYAWYRFSYRPKVGDGERVVFEGISRFRLEDGRIAHYDEVFDSGIAMSQLGFSPERIARSLAKRATAVREGSAG